MMKNIHHQQPFTSNITSSLKPPRRLDTAIAAAAPEGRDVSRLEPLVSFFWFLFCFYTILMSIHRLSTPSMSGDNWCGSRGSQAGAGDASTRHVSSPW